MKKIALYSFLITVLYIVIATSILFDSIININEDSLFYTISQSEFNIFLPGYLIGGNLGLIGGDLGVLIGQLLSFTFLFLINFIVIYLFSIIMKKLSK